MHLRIAAIAATLFVAGCASRGPMYAPASGSSGVARTTPRPSRAATDDAMLAKVSSAELRVRLNQDLGPGVSPVKDRFTAKLVAPIVGPNGRVLIPVGSLVYGHVVHVDDASRRIEIAFDRLETRTTVYRLSARVVAADPYALTVRPNGTPTSATAVLEGHAPSAIGGGPPAPESEADEDSPRGDAIVPFDGEMRLQLTAPLVAMTSI